MRCLYCDEEIKSYSLYSLFIKEDKLCMKCRKAMKFHHQVFEKDGLKIESFYEYDSLFKDILLQYKECNDEALKDIFLYKIEDYIKLKYFNYKIIYAPSCKKKLEERGYDHLKLMYSCLNLKEAKGLKMKSELNQVGKNLLERKKMLDNFTYDGGKHKRVLIVDDVYTTGSTLLGINKTIKPYCKEIKAIILGKNT